MALPATYDFAGTAGALGGDFTQMSDISNLLRNGSGAGVGEHASRYGLVFWNADAFDADQSSQITIVAANALSWAYAFVRAAGTTSTTFDGYAAYTNGGSGSGNTGISRFDNGSETEIAAVATTFTGGDDLGCEVEGTTIRFLKNQTELDDVTDATYASGAAGCGCYNILTTIVDFIGDNLAAGGGLVYEDDSFGLYRKPLEQPESIITVWS